MCDGRRARMFFESVSNGLWGEGWRLACSPGLFEHRGSWRKTVTVHCVIGLFAADRRSSTLVVLILPNRTNTDERGVLYQGPFIFAFFQRLLTVCPIGPVNECTTPSGSRRRPRCDFAFLRSLNSRRLKGQDKSAQGNTPGYPRSRHANCDCRATKRKGGRRL